MEEIKMSIHFNEEEGKKYATFTYECNKIEEANKL